MNANHIEALRRKHQELDAEIRKAENAPGADDLHIGELKRRKLVLKDELTAAGA